MEISPEERKKIYEEEKARIEEELKREKQEDKSVSSTSLEPNVAALLCYLGIWITGIIFLIIEQKNRFVRFHAIQSIIVFGILVIVGTFLNQIPFIGWFFGFTIGVLAFVLWIILMASAYKGEQYKVPLAGDIAEKATGLSSEEAGQGVDIKKGGQYTGTTAEPPAPAGAAAQAVRSEEKVESIFKSNRGGRITASSFAIAWSIVLLVFFNFYSKYIAYYQYEANQWVRYPILTDDFNIWLFLF